jgi:AraC-like DNA-binding protein
MASSVEVTAAVKIEQVRRKWDHLGMSEPATRQLEVVHEGPSFRLMDYRCRLPVLAKGPEEGPSDHQIVFVRAGLFVVDTPRGRVVADANKILFFSAGEPYTVSHPIAGGDDCLVLILSDRERQELLDAVDPKAADMSNVPFRFTHAPASPRAAVLQRCLLTLARIGATKLELEETALDLAEAAMRAAQDASDSVSPSVQERTVSCRRAAIEAVKLILMRNVAEPPRLRELARKVGYAPFHLVRTFRAQEGLPIRRYLARLRLRLALERLAEGGEDLTGLALDLGYADHSHFTNSFRREFGMSPSRFRSIANVRRLKSAPEIGRQR